MQRNEELFINIKGMVVNKLVFQRVGDASGVMGDGDQVKNWRSMYGNDVFPEDFSKVLNKKRTC